jgi:hypothetical protein
LHLLQLALGYPTRLLVDRLMSMVTDAILVTNAW